MDFEEFHKQLADAPLSFRRKLRDYLRHPTERNACYIAGYIAALEDARLFKTEDAASYWLALIDRVEGNGALGCDLIAEMDNPPAGGAQLQAEIEALRAEVDRDKALLRQALEALEFFRDTAICEADTAVATEAIVALHERLRREALKDAEVKQGEVK